jgi:O-succinylbenzoic acid--CoA ligase
MNPWISFSLTLNGKTYANGQLVELANELNKALHKNWQRHLGNFIKSWISDSDEISVQTSGSTGKPKLIRVKKSSMLASAANTCQFFQLQPNQNALLCLDTEYISGMMMVVRAMLAKLNLIVVPPIKSPLKFLADSQKIHFASMVGAQIHHSLIDETCRKFLNRMDTVIIGGSSISSYLEIELIKSEGNFWCTYGMTETLSHVALRKISPHLPPNEYTALPGVHFDLDPRGCLIIHANYLPEPVITNDLVKLLDSSHFQWLGRWDFVINSGGIKIYPEELENALSPYFHYPFFITSLSDEIKGEIPVLMVEYDQTPDEKTMNEWNKILSSVLPSKKKPQLIFTYPHFIYTSTGKIKRKQTLRQYLEKNYGKDFLST